MGGWFGNVQVTKASFFVIQRPPYSRRQLHYMVPVKKGIRGKYGGSTTPFGLRKGDLVSSFKGLAYVSGYYKSYVSLSNSNWKRITLTSVSKVSLVKKSSNLTIFTS